MRLSRHSTASMLKPAMVAASGWAPPMPPRPAVNIHLPAASAAEIAPRHLDKSLVGALHDALAADVDPGARGHLTVHREPAAIQLVKVFPCRPVRHQIRVRDEHPRRVRMRREYADRLAGLHQQGFVIVQALQRLDDAVIAVPVARRAADPAVHHELGGILRDVRVEIVHQHAQRRLGQPGAGVQGALPREARIRRGFTGASMVSLLKGRRGAEAPRHFIAGAGMIEARE